MRPFQSCNVVARNLLLTFETISTRLPTVNVRFLDRREDRRRDSDIFVEGKYVKEIETTMDRLSGDTRKEVLKLGSDFWSPCRSRTGRYTSLFGIFISSESREGGRQVRAEGLTLDA